jgi:hypothetical protein
VLTTTRLSPNLLLINELGSLLICLFYGLFSSYSG